MANMCNNFLTLTFKKEEDLKKVHQELLENIRSTMPQHYTKFFGLHVEIGEDSIEVQDKSLVISYLSRWSPDWEIILPNMKKTIFPLLEDFDLEYDESSSVIAGHLIYKEGDVLRYSLDKHHEDPSFSLKDEDDLYCATFKGGEEKGNYYDVLDKLIHYYPPEKVDF